MLKRFLQSENGNVAAVFSLSTLPILGLVGAGLDYSRATDSRTQLQRATDSAALAAIVARVPLPTQRDTIARAAFQSSNASGAEVALTTQVSSTAVTVTASASVKTAVMSVMQVDQVGITASSRAEKVFQGPLPCVLALNKNAPGAITFAGSSVFEGANCVVHTNSTSSSALTFEGTSGTATASGFCSVGGVTASRVITPRPQTYCDAMADPFEKLAHPASVGCDHTGVSVDPKQTKTLRPGIYCNGLALKGTATLEPGVYVVKNGPLLISSQATVRGTGVTFYLTGTSAGFSMEGGASMDLKAPTSGAYGGILVFQDRASNPGFENRVAGGADSIIVGAIYTPTQKVTVSGGSGFGQKSPFMTIIADQVRISGSSTSSTNMTGISLAAPLPQSLSGARLTH